MKDNTYINNCVIILAGTIIFIAAGLSGDLEKRDTASGFYAVATMMTIILIMVIIPEQIKIHRVLTIIGIVSYAYYFKEHFIEYVLSNPPILQLFN